MYDKENERLTPIYQMLLEMADGNFFYRIPRTQKVDNLEALSVLINWLSEEIHATLYHLGYVNPHVTYHYLVQSTYLLFSMWTVAYRISAPIFQIF